MIETLQVLPASFWGAVLLLRVGGIWAGTRLRDGLGFPVWAVLGTVAVWYMGDAFYNDYGGNYTQDFQTKTLDTAWWQVALFLGAFLLLTPLVNGLLNRRYRDHSSQAFLVIQTGRLPRFFQVRLGQLLTGSLWVYGVLVVIAVLRLRAETLFYFFPFLDHKADPWGRGQIGGGISALLSLASYTQIFVASVFGVVAALATDRRVRLMALVGCLLTWPYFIFDRTRNTMLAVALPAVLSWVFLRLRMSMLARLAVLGACFLVVNVWFKFVIENRSGMSFRFSLAALEQGGLNEDVHHEGLNMYEELCWVNSFLKDGSYHPNWGRRYFAELVNPIPRGFWPGKPLIGLDYAIARGQAYTESGTTAVMSTGMIGQGVVNFGPYLGPSFAAFLMAFWSAILVRLDLQGKAVGRLPLYGLGVVLTFNLGRDITFITLYTFVVGYAVVWWIGRIRSTQGQPDSRRAVTGGVRRNPTPVKAGHRLHSRRSSSKYSRVSVAAPMTIIETPDKVPNASPDALNND